MMSDDQGLGRMRRKLMERAIDDYRAGSITLRELAEGLTSLVNSLEDVPDELFEELQARANGVEAYYAIALEDGVEGSLSRDLRGCLESSLGEMKKMLNELSATDGFVTPSDGDWLGFLGVIPEELAGDGRVRRLHYQTNPHESIDLTFDVYKRSVRFKWIRKDEIIVDILRDGASLLTVWSGDGEAHMSVDFDTDRSHGQLRVKILPNVKIQDSLLLS